MTIGNKFILVFSVFFVAVLAGAFFVFKTIRDQQAEKTVVNLASRQQMLTQKYLKEYINDLIPMQVRHSTLKTAEIATLQIVEDRKQYTKNIIAKLKNDGVMDVHPDQNYINIDGGIPLPATFVQEVSGSIKEKGIYSYDLLSKWNINKEKGLNTDFEREAFDYLFEKRGTVFSRFMVHNGVFSLRYATSDVASAEGCVRCHNNHEESAKQDFKLGDVMGILVVNIPIGTVSEKTEAFFARAEGETFGENSFLKTKKMFDATLDALINGGKAPLDIDMKEFVTIHANEDRAILGKLIEVKNLWNTTQGALQKLTTVEPNSAEYIAAYDEAYTSANVTMKVMNEAVNMYHADSDRKSVRLLWIQGGSVLMICMVIGLGWILFAQPLITLLKRLVQKLADGAEQVACASGEISSASQTLAQGASEQASSLEETSASMEEILSMTKQNAQNAEETLRLVGVCTAAAENGNKAAEEVSNSMEEIAASSKKIVEITKVIDGIASQTNALALKAGRDTSQIIKQGNSFAVVAKEVRNLANKSTAAAKETWAIVEGCISNLDKRGNESNTNKGIKEDIKVIARGIKDIETIAFQTNLLALNAAVEAARASDNGEKFAVMTEEVRRLAKKSADAAKDTATLISECVTKADNGTVVATKCKDAMADIVKDVNRASALTKEITEATVEQSKGINQVSDAVHQIDQVTQQTAVNAEETASASEELAAQSQTMKEQVKILMMQVHNSNDRKGNIHKPVNSDENRAQKSEKEVASKKTSGNIILKLLFTPIYILKYTVNKMVKMSTGKVLPEGHTSGPGSATTQATVPSVTASQRNAEGNGNGKRDVPKETDYDRNLITMSGDAVFEHDNRFRDF